MSGSHYRQVAVTSTDQDLDDAIEESIAAEYPEDAQAAAAAWGMAMYHMPPPTPGPPSEKRKIFCWQCGELVLETHAYMSTYTCKLCDCAGKCSEAFGRVEFTRPGAKYKFRPVAHEPVLEPYIDFGPPSSATLWCSSPA